MNYYNLTNEEVLSLIKKWGESGEFPFFHNNEQEVRAMKFAKLAHGAQQRKYTGLPYITHTMAVAHILHEYGYNQTREHSDMRIAAYLHDVVEDTPVPIGLVYKEFGDRVGELVFWLTDVSRPQDGNRELRKKLDRTHLWAASAEAQIIKCADCLDNGRDIQKNDPDFFKVYRREIQELLRGMRPEVLATELWEDSYAATN